MYRNIFTGWIFCTDLSLLTKIFCTGISLLTGYFVWNISTDHNNVYWNILADWIFCTDLSLPPKTFCTGISLHVQGQAAEGEAEGKGVAWRGRYVVLQSFLLYWYFALNLFVLFRYFVLKSFLLYWYFALVFRAELVLTVPIFRTELVIYCTGI